MKEFDLYKEIERLRNENARLREENVQLRNNYESFATVELLLNMTVNEIAATRKVLNI